MKSSEQTNWKRVVVDFLVERDDRECQLCYQPIDGLFEIDHIIEKSKGGTDKLDNLRVVHLECHKLRHHKNQMKAVIPKIKLSDSLKEAMDHAKRDFIYSMLQSHEWNISKTAATLKMSRPTLYDTMKKLKIKKVKTFSYCNVNLQEAIDRQEEKQGTINQTKGEGHAQDYR